VSLLEYASKRSRFLPFVKLISFVDQLLEDSEYYVQKGVAWTIREIYNVYPIETLEYLEKNILRIQPEAFLLQLKSSIRLLNPHAYPKSVPDLTGLALRQAMVALWNNRFVS
jgi:hypothetical protein